jgi:hypothetical protein
LDLGREMFSGEAQPMLFQLATGVAQQLRILLLKK